MLTSWFIGVLAAVGPMESGTIAVPTSHDSATFSLEAAVAQALAHNPSLTASVAEARAGDARVDAAHAAWWPRVGAEYLAMRSDDPVTVFAAKLSERRFTEADFAIDALNQPAPLTTHRLALALDTSLWDGGDRGRGVRTAQSGQAASHAARAGETMGVIASVVGAYFAVHVAERSIAVVAQALTTSDANLARAEARHAAGLATEADVLSLRAQRSELLLRRIRAQRGVALARAELNRLMGQPLGRAVTLTTVLTAPPPAVRDLDALTNRALALRPDLAAAGAGLRAASVALDGERAWWQPRVGLRAVVQHDAEGPFESGGESFTVMLSARVDLTSGLGAGRARIAEAAAAVTAARARLAQAEAVVALDVMTALVEVEAASARVTAARDGVAAAVAARDILSSRYDAGLSDVTSLLMAESVVVGAQFEDLDARFAARMSHTRLDLAVGELTPDSPSLGDRSTP